MRSFILGIVVLMAVPAYAVGQQRDRSERAATARTAVPRENHEDTKANHEDTKARNANHEGAKARPASNHEGTTARSRPSAAETVRERSRERRERSAPGGTYWTNSPRLPGGPASIALPAHGLRPYPDHDHRQRHRGPVGGANVVFVPYAAPVVVEREVIVEREFVEEVAAAPVIVEQPSLARLILDIHPATAQVFADGYYIGIPEDFRFEDGGAVLEPGPHRIDIIARGYEPVSFDVNLTRGQSATFRHMLTPAPAQDSGKTRLAPDAPVKAPPAPKQPATFYLIPGCYMGNVPPKEANLPATCDIARAVSMQY